MKVSVQPFLPHDLIAKEDQENEEPQFVNLETPVKRIKKEY